MPEIFEPRFTVTLLVPAAESEAISDRFWSCGASAVVELAAVELAAGDLEEVALAGSEGLVRLIGDLTPSGIRALKAESLVTDAQVIGIEPIDADFALSNEWRKHAKAWVCADRILLRPQWVSADVQTQQRVDQGELLEIVLEPGSAFGSGSHMTTRLCVGQVSQLDLTGCRVLDVGCGTGVLSVASVLLGADSVQAVDSDPEAIRVTRLVAELNNSSEKIQTLPAQGFVSDGTEFDLVLANLLLPIIEEAGADLMKSVVPSGLIMVSGVLTHQKLRVEEVFSEFNLLRVEEDEGWLVLVFQRPDSAARQ